MLVLECVWETARVWEQARSVHYDLSLATDQRDVGQGASYNSVKLGQEEHQFPIAKGVGRGELKIKLSIPNPTTSAHLVHLSAELRIGEAFGFNYLMVMNHLSMLPESLLPKLLKDVGGWRQLLQGMLLPPCPGRNYTNIQWT
jgi:hypothetical protein